MICTGTGAADTVMLRVCVAVWALESCTLTVKLEVPAVVGVPVIDPELSESPAGRDPDEMDQVYGVVPPVGASDCE